MRRLVTFALFLLVAALPAVAQETPYGEFFGGYSYLRLNPPSEEGFDSPGQNLHGWNASVLGNVTRNFGIEGDFSGTYGNLSLGDFDFDIDDINMNFHTFMGGVRYTGYMENTSAFVHGLAGASRLSLGQDGISISKTGFSMALGGGFDVKMNDRVAIRVAQLDYLMYRFNVDEFADFGDIAAPGTQTMHNWRYSAGVVFRFGNK